MFLFLLVSDLFVKLWFVRLHKVQKEKCKEEQQAEMGKFWMIVLSVKYVLKDYCYFHFINLNNYIITSTLRLHSLREASSPLWVARYFCARSQKVCPWLASFGTGLCFSNKMDCFLFISKLHQSMLNHEGKLCLVDAKLNLMVILYQGLTLIIAILLRNL